MSAGTLRKSTGPMDASQRIQDLIDLSVEEGIPCSGESLSGLRRVLADPLIFLRDNGNFRVRWNFSNVQVAIEITGAQSAEVVVIKKP